MQVNPFPDTATVALALALAGAEGRDADYLSDLAGSEAGHRDGFDAEAQALMEDLASQGWKIVQTEGELVDVA